jgi:hypothetical protein
VAEAGLGPRFQLLAGDLFQVELSVGTYDMAIAGSLCHLFDADANRRLFGRLYGALRPGGWLAVADVVPDERRPRRWSRCTSSACCCAPPAAGSAPSGPT